MLDDSLYEEDVWQRHSRLMLNSLKDIDKYKEKWYIRKQLQTYPCSEKRTFDKVVEVYGKQNNVKIEYMRLYRYNNESLVWNKIAMLHEQRRNIKAMVYSDILESINLIPEFKEEITNVLQHKLDITKLDVKKHLIRQHEIDWLLGTNFVNGEVEVNSRKSYVLRNALTLINTIDLDVLTDFLNHHTKFQKSYDLFGATGVPAMIQYNGGDNFEFTLITNHGTLTYHELNEKCWFTVESHNYLTDSDILLWISNFSEDIFLVFSYLLISLNKHL